MRRDLVCRALIPPALAATVLPLGTPLAVADGAPAITLSPTAAPPGTAISAIAAFGAYEAVDVYFDPNDESLAVTDGTGGFSTSITIPSNASAPLGIHHLTATCTRFGLPDEPASAARPRIAQLHPNGAFRPTSACEELG